MQEIGIARLHRIGRVGPYELSEKSYDSGPTWEDYLASNPSLTTASANGGGTEEDDDPADKAEYARAKRAEAAAKALPATPLVAAGPSGFALSIAQQRLGIDTAGDLARVPARRITALRGIGSVPRYELVRLSREWRQRFSLAEEGPARADIQWAGGEKPGSVRDQKDLDSERTGVTAGPHIPAETPEDLALLPLNRVVRQLIPDTPELARVTGLAPAADGAARRRPADQARRRNRRSGRAPASCAR